MYDNSRGSTLLFEARSRVLHCRTYRARYQEVDMSCTACGEKDETAENFIVKGFALQLLKVRLILRHWVLRIARKRYTLGV